MSQLIKRSMYDISQELTDLYNQLEENGGELTTEMEQALTIAETDLQIKAIDYCYLVKELEGSVNTIDNEIKRLQALKKVRANLCERLKTTVETAMRAFEIQEVKTPAMRLSLRKSTAVLITDESKIGDQFFKIEKTPMKKEIKTAIEQGLITEGAEIKTNYSLQIN